MLRSGMYADARLLIDEKKDTLLVSRDAVTLIDDQPTVYVINGDRVEQRQVSTGLENDGQIEILSGLKEGDTVVTAGQPNLVDGAKVEVVNRL